MSGSVAWSRRARPLSMNQFTAQASPENGLNSCPKVSEEHIRLHIRAAGMDVIRQFVAPPALGFQDTEFLGRCPRLLMKPRRRGLENG